ncbi:uncharacterized protein CTRU02_208332 [Colletotrichum truncatum]|uniref:Uncharacterized protein n=1 Tax=Colletotrichum truncatum TaxID=5467 RepID=A0ACC3YW58_COLTU|nr:uncharacterized protein CTRU02_07484 [Colletotrichum truncatum]KAF6791144.1 hypothetical protein CTRU02_07484 [Colletotrichum truncatum]
MPGDSTAYPDMPGAAAHQDNPPQYESIPHVHRMRHYASSVWEAIKPNACFAFDSSLALRDSTATAESQWEGRLHVKTLDLLRLMRDGFHWTTANFDITSNYILMDIDNAKEDTIYSGWTCSRSYFLSDLGDEPYWTAKLVVYARNTGVLSKFRPTQLSLENMRSVSAWREDVRRGIQQWIYDWDVEGPEEAFNAIYDDMPLEGWWPWPKHGDNVVLGSESSDGD